MSYWDTSALLKLFVDEADSASFLEQAISEPRIVTSVVSYFEALTAFRRLETIQALNPGEAAQLAADFGLDATSGKIVLQDLDDAVGRSFAEVLDRCYSVHPPIFIRTNDALHLASAMVAAETTFISADARQRAAASLLGLVVLPAEADR